MLYYIKSGVETPEELDYRPNRVASALAMSGTPWRFAVVHPAWEGSWDAVPTG